MNTSVLRKFVSDKKKKSFFFKLNKLRKTLGPGLITGASDDDPSGIATYSQAGAKFGMATLWTAFVTFPLMAAIQEMCARIGIVTSRGLTSNIKAAYPRIILYLMMVCTFPAVILNIGADIAGMGAVAHLIIPSVSSLVFSFIFTILLIILIVYLPYRRITLVLKYLCAFLLLYIIVPFLSKQNWFLITRHAFIPTIKLNKDFISILIAILGTTISPYLFFWQATMEAEDVLHKKKKLVVDKRIIENMNREVDFGMFFSNLIMFFIILTTGTVLHYGGITEVNSVEDAAKALEPLAGKLSHLLFSLGVIGTGFLAVPVLCGSLSYMLSEAFGWNASLDKKYYEAKSFYMVVVMSLLIGLGINYIGVNPIQALIYTAVLYGITAPFLIGIVLHISNNKKIMGPFTNSRISNILGFATLIIMLAAIVTFFYLWVSAE